MHSKFWAAKRRRSVVTLSTEESKSVMAYDSERIGVGSYEGFESDEGGLDFTAGDFQNAMNEKDRVSGYVHMTSKTKSSLSSRVRCGGKLDYEAIVGKPTFSPITE
jgi:hypothetical protein